MHEPHVSKCSVIIKCIALAAYPYASQDYASLERIMVKFFDWNLLVPTAATFLEYYVEQITLNGPQEYHKDGREHRKCTDGVVAQLASNYLDIALTGEFQDYSFLLPECILISMFSVCVCCRLQCFVWTETFHSGRIVHRCCQTRPFAVVLVTIYGDSYQIHIQRRRDQYADFADAATQSTE